MAARGSVVASRPVDVRRSSGRPRECTVVVAPPPASADARAAAWEQWVAALDWLLTQDAPDA
jgi:hypothetical protein